MLNHFIGFTMFLCLTLKLFCLTVSFYCLIYLSLTKHWIFINHLFFQLSIKFSGLKFFLQLNIKGEKNISDRVTYTTKCIHFLSDLQLTLDWDCLVVLWFVPLLLDQYWNGVGCSPPSPYWLRSSHSAA